MQYLGRLFGEGVMTRDGEAISRVAYEFEGFARPGGQIMSSGEIEGSVADLHSVFGRPGVQLLTDDGRVFDLKFSQKALAAHSGVALVEVSGDLPKSKEKWDH